MNNKFEIEKSPFIDKGKDIKVHHEEVNSLSKDLIIVKKKYYQSGHYIKQIISDKIDVSLYFNLSSTSKDLLYYITTILEYNNPIFKLKVSVIKHLLNKGESTIHKSIRELIDKDYIARTGTKELYWINHNRYFKGNYTFEIYAENKPKTKINKNEETSNL